MKQLHFSEVDVSVSDVSDTDNPWTLVIRIGNFNFIIFKFKTRAHTRGYYQQ